MNKIEAAALMAFAAAVFMGLADGKSIARDPRRQALLVFNGFVALLGIAWALDSATSVSGALILILVPVGAAAIGTAGSLAIMDARGDFAGRKWIVAAAVIVCIGAWIVGFPGGEE